MTKRQLKVVYKNGFVAPANGSKYLESLSKLFRKRLVIRNPWGRQSGRLSHINGINLLDNIKLYKIPEDGSSYIPSLSFLKYFGSFMICRLNPTDLHTFFRMTNSFRKSN
eukprot:GHVR01184546.1.p1 GENE.GHVR01184546.1~~GHVR01184546.1.p1  ORF type:complete len:110 (+),score=1.07 GHVR01184546.1:868-1197(+)